MASFSVITNTAASNAQANLYTTNVSLKSALTRVSSGLRINFSGDDAAGLAVANSYRSDVAIMKQGIRNANDGLSSLQIKDGALDNMSKLLDRLATLASQSASGTTTASSRATLNKEFSDVISEITREGNVAELNTSKGFSVYMSAESTVSNGIVNGTISAADTTTLGIATAKVDSQANAQAAVASVQTAISKLGTVQGEVGQIQNRLSYAISLAQTQVVNKMAAESRIRDANMAEESANLNKSNILNQAGLAALSQANQSTAAVLSLLR